MPRITAILLCLSLCLGLSACLTTPRPVFGTADSVAAGDSPAFLAFVELWEARDADADTPRDLIAAGARVIEVDGQALVQEAKADGTADYYLLGRMGARPVACMLDDRELGPIAAAHGVTLTIEREPDRPGSLPAPVLAEGPDEALRAFILDAFRDAALACSSIARGG